MTTYIDVPAGEFWMGASPDNCNTRQPEHPRHRVILTWPFRLGASPVTRAEWRDTMEHTSQQRSTLCPELPAVAVSWFDAIDYCNTLSQHAGLEEAYALTGILRDTDGRIRRATVRWKGLACLGYRLPTEAEWECACWAQTSMPREIDAVAWHYGNSDRRAHPVRAKDPNPWGFYDMLGNVKEWCWDRKDLQYPPDTRVDPTGPITGRERATRGGSWATLPCYATASARSWESPASRYDYLGFRVAQTQDVTCEVKAAEQDAERQLRRCIATRERYEREQRSRAASYEAAWLLLLAEQERAAAAQTAAEVAHREYMDAVNASDVVRCAYNAMEAAAAESRRAINASDRATRDCDACAEALDTAREWQRASERTVQFATEDLTRARAHREETEARLRSLPSPGAEVEYPPREGGREGRRE